MAYQEDFSDDKDKKAEDGSTVIGPSASAENTSAGSANSNASQSGNTGTGYTNLSSYLNANQPQANQMATGITSGVTDQLNGVKAKATQFGTDVGNIAKDNTVQDQGVIGKLQSSPGDFANSDWINNYNKQMGGYKGPTDVSQIKKDGANPYQDISNQYNNIDQTVKGLSTPGGIEGKLGDIYGKQNPNYTQGQKGLDSFLISGAQKDSNVNNYINDYNKQDNLGAWQKQTQALNSQLGAAKQTSDATRDSTAQAYQKALSGITGGFDQAKQNLATSNATAKQGFQNDRSALSNLDSSALQKVGVSGDEAKYLKGQGIDLGSLLQESQQYQKLGDVADQGQVSNYKALLGLTPGQQSQYDFSGGGNNAYGVNSAQKGSYDNLYNQYLASIKPPAPVAAPQVQSYTADPSASALGTSGILLPGSTQPMVQAIQAPTATAQQLKDMQDLANQQGSGAFGSGFASPF